MKLGFVSAILPELSLEEVLEAAAEIGYDCVEVMCWPKGRAERRYAGVTHIDVTSFDAPAASQIHALVDRTGVSISALGYYPIHSLAIRPNAPLRVITSMPSSMPRFFWASQRSIRLLAAIIRDQSTITGRSFRKYGRLWCSTPPSGLSILVSRIVPCFLPPTNGRAARIWLSALLCGGGCSRRFLTPTLG